jgi:regulator of protease activity HflC (stomatin/prohibitin superfamily)
MNEEDLSPEKPKRKRVTRKKTNLNASASQNVTPTLRTQTQKGKTHMQNMSISKLIGLFAGVFLVIAILFSLPKIVENVDTTEYKIKQAAITGQMSCHNESGWFLQGLGSVTTYDKTGTFYFSEDNVDGGEGEDADPLPATFQGNSTGKVTGYLKYRLPNRCEYQLALNSEYKDQGSVRMDLVRNALSTAIGQAGPMFTAEEANIDRRPEFTKIVREILEQGEFLTVTTEVERIEDGDSSNAQKYKITKMYLDSNGNRVITKPSVLKRYGIEVIALDIKRISFDQKTKELMDAKKNAEQQRIASKALAEKSKQDAITEKAQGEARTAKAKADQEVIKIAEVTQAEKQFEVARLAALTANEEAKKVKAKGEAEAFAARAKVSAGLTPQERAEWDFKIADAVSRNLSQSTGKWVPEIIINGEGKGGGSNPLDAVGMNMLLDIAQKMKK